MIKIDILMPASCKECPFCDEMRDFDGTVMNLSCYIVPHVPALVNVTKYTDSRPEYCPLMKED